MVSSFYNSNEQKQNNYVKSNYKKQYNQESQQQVVDAEIDKELGLETQATNLGKLASRVVNKISSELPQLGYSETKQLTYSPIQLLTNSINNGQLTNLFDELKALPDSALNKTQQLIRNDLSNAENKKMINYQIEDALPNGSDAIANAVIESMGGIGNEKLVLDMISKVETKKLPGRPVESLDTKKERHERKLMSKEDVVVREAQKINN
jgi:capsular polysaccharide biosynthesis protein